LLEALGGGAWLRSTCSAPILRADPEGLFVRFDIGDLRP
jgi:hypothetical protein